MTMKAVAKYFKSQLQHRYSLVALFSIIFLSKTLKSKLKIWDFQ